MSNGTRFALVFGGLVAVVVAVFFLMNVSYGNAEIDLRNRATAVQKSNEAVFDNTWKIVQQQAQIADQYKQAFRQIYPELMAGRYGNARGGALLSFITESNPNFDPRLYDKLMTSVEAQRTAFTREQQKLIDVKREHDNLRMKFPGSMFVGSRPELKIVIVTSARTDETFRTGQDNNVDLFPPTSGK